MSYPFAKLSRLSGIRFLVDLSCRLFGLPSISDLETQLEKEKVKLQQIIRQQKTLYRVISKIRASLDLETIFRTTTKETCKLLSAERVAVYRFYEDWGGEFVGDFEFAEAGWQEAEVLGKNTVWNDSYLQQNQGGRYRNNETLVVSDIYLANLSQCHIDVLEQFYIRAYATAPIFIGQKLWGILAAYQHSQTRDWEASEVEFLAQVALQLGFAVQQAELLAKTQQRARDLHEASEQQKILLRLIVEIRESLDLDTLFKTTAREARKALRADRVGIFRFEPDSDYCSGSFVSESVLPAYTSTMDVAIYDHCFGESYAENYHNGRMQVLNSIYNAGLKDCHIALLERFQIKAQIIIPLMNGETLWGLLCIHQCSEPRQWTLAEIQFVKQLAAQFSVALGHSDLLAQTRSQSKQLTQTLKALQQANFQLEELARIDALTQIPNRRYFDEVFDKEWQRLRRDEQILSLILFDIDYFKLYNDSYGHQAGDDCLRQIARAARRVLKRSTDLVARYGGEEFVVILPNIDQPNAIEVARQIQAAVRDLAIPHPTVPTGQKIVTVSLGIASQIPALDKTPQDLFVETDQALYAAKKQGRDRWVCAS